MRVCVCSVDIIYVLCYAVCSGAEPKQAQAKAKEHANMFSCGLPACLAMMHIKDAEQLAEAGSTAVSGHSALLFSTTKD